MVEARIREQRELGPLERLGLRHAGLLQRFVEADEELIGRLVLYGPQTPEGTASAGADRHARQAEGRALEAAIAEDLQHHIGTNAPRLKTLASS